MRVDTQVESPLGELIRVIANKACGLVPELVEWRVVDALERNGKVLLERHGVPGLQLCLRIGQRDPVDVAMGSARLSQEGCAGRPLPMTYATEFVTGSLSKPITAAYALVLVQDGVLELDAPLGELGDEIALAQHSEGVHEVWRRYCREVSVRQLLTHTSGIASVHPPHLEPDACPQNLGSTTPRASALVKGEEVRGLAGVWPGIEFIAPPGTQTCYSGANYLLLEFVIERLISNRVSSFSRCMDSDLFAVMAESRLFEPLGLRKCGYQRAVAAGNDIADFHAHNDMGRTERIDRMGVIALGASGFTGSCRDVVTIISHLLLASKREKGQLAIDEYALSDSAQRRSNSGRLGLDPSLAQLLFRLPLGQKGSARTFTHGFHLYKDRDLSLLDHGGERPGYRGVIHVYPRREVVVCIMTNGEHGAKVHGSILGLIKGMLHKA